MWSSDLGSTASWRESEWFYHKVYTNGLTIPIASARPADEESSGAETPEDMGHHGIVDVSPYFIFIFEGCP